MSAIDDASLDDTGVREVLLASRADADAKLPAMKPYWDITNSERKACLEATTLHPSSTEYSLAAQLRIPVSMHNVGEEKIFRPSAWAAFGTEATTSADFRACANFGPLYGTRR
jgi:hypothetical protein